MQWSDLPLKPSLRTLRQFGGLCVVFFGGLAAWNLFAHADSRTAAILGVLAAVAGLLGLVAPGVLRPIFVGALIVAFPIGWVVSRVILVVLFVLAITPVGLLFRMRGRDVLGLRRRATESYWVPKAGASDLNSYFRQF
jgi:hypothetical protein